MVESVDTGDLKSPGSDTVRVRVPSAAPKRGILHVECASFSFGLGLEPISNAAVRWTAACEGLTEQHYDFIESCYPHGLSAILNKRYDLEGMT